MARRILLKEPRHFVQQAYEIPKPQANEVLVRVTHCGICGTDLHAYCGSHPSITTPIVLGHEFSGVVEVVGANATGVREGARVTANPITSCGSCRNCREGRTNACEAIRVIGCQLPGAHQSHLVIDETKVVELPTAISQEDGAVLEPVAVACHALLTRRPIRHGEYVLVLGCGPIGAFCAQVAHAGGAESVIGVDVDPFRLKIAASTGCDHVINSRCLAVREYLENNHLFGRIDVVVDCVGGDGGALDGVLEWIPRGIDVISIGVFARPVSFAFLDAISERELRVVGSTMYTTGDLAQAARLVANGVVRVAPLVTHIAPIAQGPLVFQQLTEGMSPFMKVLLAHER